MNFWTFELNSTRFSITLDLRKKEKNGPKKKSCKKKFYKKLYVLYKRNQTFLALKGF